MHFLALYLQPAQSGLESDSEWMPKFQQTLQTLNKRVLTLVLSALVRLYHPNPSAFRPPYLNRGLILINSWDRTVDRPVLNQR